VPDVTLTIDGASVTVTAGTTILKAAEKLGRQVPTICYHEHCTANGLCRICVVEVDGVKPLLPACLSPVNEAMKVSTSSARAERSRRTILELLDSAVDLSEAPEIQKFIEDYRADRSRFPEGKRREAAVRDDNPMYIRDYSKCILCWRCVQVCADDAQFTYAINFKGAASTPVSAPSLTSPCRKRAAYFAASAWAFAPPARLSPSARRCSSRDSI